MYDFIECFKKHYIGECFLTNLNFIWLLSLTGERSFNFENICLGCIRRDALTNKVFHNKGFVLSYAAMNLNDLADSSLKDILTSLLAQRQIRGNLLNLRLTDGCFKVEDKDLFYHFTKPLVVSDNRYGFDGSALSGSGFNRTPPTYC